MFRYLLRWLKRHRLRPLGKTEPKLSSTQNPLVKPTAAVGLTKNAVAATEATGGAGSSLGVLQKSGVINANAVLSPTAPMVATRAADAGNEAAVGENRFGASSNNCNSFDSGIKIKFGRDEEYVHPAASGQRGVDDALTNMPSTLEAGECSRQAEEQTKQKSLVHKGSKLLARSLSTRSFSQPNGLEIFRITRNSIKKCGSNSIALHKEANSYFPIYAEVVHNFIAAGPQELFLQRGTLIEVLRKVSGPWWLGRQEKQELLGSAQKLLVPEIGWFPKDFVRIVPRPAAMLRDKPPHTNQKPGRRNNATLPLEGANNRSIIEPLPPVIRNDCDILRRFAVRELLDTEINYVKLLGAMCDRYLPAMSQRPDVFSPSSIRLIFSNISTIYKFQRKFLEALRSGIEQKQLSKVFLQMHKGFLCYSAYCNAYSRAIVELEACERLKDARDILEHCSKSGSLADLPLSAHLLAPVQRICRYPLHLGQLLKTALNSNGSDSTSDIGLQADVMAFEHIDVSQFDIPDTYDTINAALTQMRSIAEAVNESKRHSETIARYQDSFQSFKGAPLHMHSTRFFHQVDVMRQKQNLWNSSYTLFLFDNQIVYCKRDVIKRSQFFYKGRILLDSCRVVNMEDGKVFGYTIKNSLRIYCRARDKWYDFSFRSAIQKHAFLNALAQERQFVRKTLYVTEMTGSEYCYEARPADISDHSDNEAQDCAHAGETRSACGDSSLPQSSAKRPFRNGLPKISESRCAAASTSTGSGQIMPARSTVSISRRGLSSWFRKPKSYKLRCGLNADSNSTAAAIQTVGTFTSVRQENNSSFA